MKTEYCDNCGTILEEGVCSNCHEELFIMTFQGDDIVEPLSKEFQEKAAKQKAEVSQQKYQYGRL